MEAEPRRVDSSWAAEKNSQSPLCRRELPKQRVEGSMLEELPRARAKVPRRHFPSATTSLLSPRGSHDSAGWQLCPQAGVPELQVEQMDGQRAVE